MDRRDGVTWVALELTRQGEQKAEEGTLEGELREILGIEDDHPVFIPSRVYARGGKKITVHLMEGYCFVASGLDEVDYFKLEQDNKLVSKIMTASGPHGMRVLKTIPNRQIEELRQQLSEIIASDITSGMRVHVIEGKYKRLCGTVLYVEGDYAIVYLDELRTLKSVTRIPRVLLESAEIIEGGA